LVLYFPTEFKLAVVKPLLNNRVQTSTLPQITGQYHTLITSQKYLNGSSSPALTHTLSFPPNFNQLQSAYSKMHSCETALCKTLNDIYLSSDSGKWTSLVSLDLSAAFDTIDHNILLNRLCTRFGITGSPLAWLTSYLSSRTRCVCVGNASSGVTDCHTGVPQGSVLGPILFSRYISPIADLVLPYRVLLQQYADDTQLCIAC